MVVLVLLSDFGTKDAYASLMRAAAKKINSDLHIEDLTHGIQRFCVYCGAYVLYTSYKWFPEDSIFVAVVDPGVGGPRRGIIIKAKNTWFVGPDNGILWPVIEENSGESEAFVIDEKRVVPWPISSTFHGRDVFAPAAARISRGEDPLSFSYKTNIHSLKTLSLRYSEEIDGARCFKVIYVDGFGDVVLSAEGEKAKELLSIGKVRVLYKGGEIGEAIPTTTFSLVPTGAIALYINSFGFLELSINMSSLAEKFGLEVGDKVCLKQ
ncbi:MAG: SAM-dependent chlorinase/fluorinase [Desulfurococcales archaeon]|jgi:S-adenosylmethionine hydrolase|uniref:SAM-dependent chlorinase/fluorinase n=1 Tax=Fervidicoccus fontis TaxID=683846 RepID=A0A7J3SLM5_9CREN